ncbi:hypothetical protein OBK23_10405 [Empedobacter falsenii]|uniref:hypothetical protein n=1 Tax=Empedobacter falsenii TaxID=343874 RepID=UPI003A81196D
MKQFIKTILNKVILVCVFASLFQGCNSDDGVVSCVPNTIVNVSININLPLYSNLNNPGGWAYVYGATAGSRGLIVVRTASGFKAYDRNAPHICPAQNTTLNVVDDMVIVCEADGAKWALINGMPIKGTKAYRDMKFYQVYVNANGTLTITN